jgi:predicted RNA-binding protein with RPS1 domain
MYIPGQIVEGVITGIQPYGAFVYIDEKTSGLVHISELSDSFVRDIAQYVQIGEKVTLKIIDVDSTGHQLRLSLKAARQQTLRSASKGNRTAKIPKGNLGFTTLAKLLPQWIAQAKEKKHD